MHTTATKRATRGSASEGDDDFPSVGTLPNATKTRRPTPSVPARSAARSAVHAQRPGVVIKPGHADDTRAIRAIELSAFPHANDCFSLRQIRGLVTNPRALAITASRSPGLPEDGEHGPRHSHQHDPSRLTVGWAVALIRRHPRWNSGRIYSIAVAPHASGTGVGRLLLGTLLDRLDVAGVRRVYLESRANNHAAIALYESAGFRIVRALDGYYDGDDGVRMLRS